MGVRKSDTGRVPAEKLRVCYTPTPANKLILKKIGPLLEGCVLEALPEEKEERRTLLEQITSLRNTIFIWEMAPNMMTASSTPQGQQSG